MSEFLVWQPLALLLWGCHQKRSPPPQKKKLMYMIYPGNLPEPLRMCKEIIWVEGKTYIYIYICSRLGFTLFYAFSRLKQYKWNVWQRAICDNNIWSMACPSWPSLRMAMLEKKLLAKLVVSWYLGAFQTNLEFGILTKLWWVFGLVNGSMKKCNAEVDDKVTKFEVHWMTSFFSMNWDFWRLDFS